MGFVACLVPFGLALAGTMLLALGGVVGHGSTDPQPRASENGVSDLEPESQMTLTATSNLSIYLPILASGYSAYRPDLTIPHVVFYTPHIVAGRPVRFGVVVHNQGAGDTAHGGVPDWFTVEVYVKDRSFTPPGLPSGPLDHAGGYCSDASLNCATGTQRTNHVTFLGNLGPGESHEAVFTFTFPEPEVYDLYIQVDTTWQASGYTGEPWGQHREEDEDNNMLAVDDFLVPPPP
jgi:hypothetical protein